MKQKLEKLTELQKKIKNIYDEARPIIKEIEEDLYFSVINMTNIIKVDHIINGMSFYIRNDDGSKKIIFMFKFELVHKYVLQYDDINYYFSTKEEMFDEFYKILKQEFPQQLRKLKFNNLIN